jgi:hypothetical protein
MGCKVKLLYWSRFVIVVYDKLHNVVDLKKDATMPACHVTKDLSPVTTPLGLLTI